MAEDIVFTNRKHFPSNLLSNHFQSKNTINFFHRHFQKSLFIMAFIKNKEVI